MTKSSSHPPDLGLQPEACEASIGVLQTLLADLSILQLKTHGCHWNVQGPQFPSLHRLFGDQYGALGDRVDEVAERIRQLGSFPAATMASYLKISSLMEIPDASQPIGCQDMVRTLLEDHEAIIRNIREGLGEVAADAGTANFLTGMMERHEKDAWMLRATLASA